MGNAEMIACLEQHLKSICDDYWHGLNLQECIVSDASSLKSHVPVYPLSHQTWDKFLEIDVTLIEPTELANILDILVENVAFTDTYLLLAKELKHLAAGQKAWVEKQLKELRK